MDMIVVPEPGMAKEIGQQLLELADNPHQVHWVSWPTPGGFKVPQELAARFHASQGTGSAEEAEPRKRRPGRPRKQIDAPAPVLGPKGE